MRRIALLLLLATSSSVLIAQSSPPPETEQFAFLIGEWDLEGYFTTKAGQRAPYKARLTARRTHEGFALADDLQIVRAGTVVFHSTGYRAFNPARKRWLLHVFYRGENSWQVFEGEARGADIVMTSEPREGEITRARYHDISSDGFSWTADVSSDGGKTWRKDEMFYRCTRIRPDGAAKPDETVRPE